MSQKKRLKKKPVVVNQRIHLVDGSIKNLELEFSPQGFTLWVTEPGKMYRGRSVKHWLVDASTLYEDGQLRLGAEGLYPTEARYNKKLNSIIISKE